MCDYILANQAALGKWLFAHYEQIVNGERWDEIEAFADA